MIAKNNERMESLVNTASRLSGDRSVQEACEARIMHRLNIKYPGTQDTGKRSDD